MRETHSLVYVVDDDVSMRESVASLLRSAGVGVTTFASAQEFLVRCRTELPSCLVLDVRLPGLSGLDTQQELARLSNEDAETWWQSLRREADVGFTTCRRGHRIVVRRVGRRSLTRLH